MNQRLVSILKFCFVITAAFASAPAFSQRIDTVLNKYADEYQQERVYLQYDKPAYAPGETIWFKAYLLSGILPSEDSKNFYVDFADANGNLLSHTVFPIVEGSSRGQFQVPLNFTNSSIHVRAYTNWMLNFDSAFLYNKDIRVIQKTSKPNSVKPIASLHFFPEGGDAITGIKMKIAFKANDQFGIPVNIKGVVVNSKGAVVDSLKAMHDGMGFVYLEQKQGETYTAKWNDEQGTAHQTPLPPAKPVGLALQVYDVAGNKNFTIIRSPDAPDNLKQLHIVATVQQQAVYVANVKLVENSIISGSIPVKELPSGIMLVTLFDDNWQPQAERIVFINNNEAVFTPEVGFAALGFSKRGKNVININLPDTILANLSIAVTDAGLGTDSSNNIISSLLLTSEIKGSVYKPYYYFSDTTKVVADNLDLVMLTHGWRRFNWQQVVQAKYPPIKYPKDTSYLYFSGKVFGATPDQIRAAGDIMMIVTGKDSSTQTLSLPVASNGTFQDPQVMLFDTVKVYYQFLKNRAFGEMSEVRFMNGLNAVPKKMSIDRDATVQLLDTVGLARLKFLADEEDRLRELLKGANLDNVTVTTKTKSKLQILDEKYASGLFSGQDAYQFDLTSDISARSAPSIFTYLQGKVAGLQITTSAAPGGLPTLSWRGGSPDLFLNEMKVDADQINNISVPDVAYIKVFRPPFFGAFGGGAGGAIAVYTRKGNDQQTQNTGKSLPYKLVAGYTFMKEFYAPDYGTFDQRNEQEDVRSTLYWNPMILTTAENHLIKLSFYNNDVTSSFRVIVEGVSKDGKLTHIEKVVE